MLENLTLPSKHLKFLDDLGTGEIPSALHRRPSKGEISHRRYIFLLRNSFKRETLAITGLYALLFIVVIRNFIKDV